MRKPFKERQQFWCLFFFFRVFRQPITNLVSSGSNCRSSSAALFAFLSAAIIFRVGTPTDTTSSRTGLAAHKWWKRGERATRDDRAGRRGVHRMARSHFSFLYWAARSLTNDNLGWKQSHQWCTSTEPRDLRPIRYQGMRTLRDLRRIRGEGTRNPRDLRRMGSGQFMIFEIRSDGCGYFAQRPTDGCDWVSGWAVLGTQFLFCCWNLMHKLKERKNK